VIASGAVLAFGGVPGDPEMTPEEIAAVVEVAHRHGLRVAAHAHGARSIREAILAGADTIEHASLIDDQGIALARDHHVALSMDIYDGDYIDTVGREEKWPEEFLRKNVETTEAQRQGFTRAHAAGVPLVFGTLRKQGGISRNTAVVALPDGSYSLYDKRFLVPFGEHIPLADWIPVLRNRVAGMSHLKAGEAPPLVELAGLTAHLSICYEAIFPQAVARDAVGADLLLNLTNDEWFGPVGAPEMHLMAQTFRAIENRRPLVRVTNTGISAWVDLRGRVQARSPLNVATQGQWQVPLAASWSLFALAPWAVTVGLWLVGLALALPWRRRGTIAKKAAKTIS